MNRFRRDHDHECWNRLRLNCIKSKTLTIVWVHCVDVFLKFNSKLDLFYIFRFFCFDNSTKWSNSWKFVNFCMLEFQITHSHILKNKCRDLQNLTRLFEWITMKLIMIFLNRFTIQFIFSFQNECANWFFDTFWLNDSFLLRYDVVRFRIKKYFDLKVFKIMISYI